MSNPAPGTTSYPPTGLLLVDKPTGPTSHDVVGRARAVLGTRRVGHAGTLDPMATGLLVLGVGRATKLLGHLALSPKGYTATIRLGQATDTDDAHGTITARTDAGDIDPDALAAAMDALTGSIDQVPSTVSAIKVDGRRAYARVRDGEEVRLAARPVTVDRFEMSGPPRSEGAVTDLDVVVDCSAGTYVRALARDLGAALGVGAHLTALRRVRVGPFEVSAAVDLYPDGVPPRGGPRPEITSELRERVAGAVIDPAEVARRAFVVRELDGDMTMDLGYGRPVAAAGIDGVYAALAPDGGLVALLRDDGGLARPVLVWRPAGEDPQGGSG